MKSKITTLILSLITSISFGQITFVKEVTGYDYLGFPNRNHIDDINLLENGKYIIAELTSQIEFSKKIDYEILDMNFTLYKKLKLDTLGGYSIWSKPKISDHLFNTDDKIEYWYTLVNAKNWELKKTIIADEDNNILMILEGEYFDYEDFYIMDGKTYVRTYSNNNSIKIYEVAGNLPCIQCNSKTSNTNPTQSPAPNYAFKIFPNPTDGQLNIESDLDELNMQIKIYSTSGQLLQTDPFFYGTNSVNVSSVASGTYVINIVSDKGFLHTEKFVKR
jgi:hypothetical protein